MIGLIFSYFSEVMFLSIGIKSTSSSSNMIDGFLSLLEDSDSLTLHISPHSVTTTRWKLCWMLRIPIRPNISLSEIKFSWLGNVNATKQSPLSLYNVRLTMLLCLQADFIDCEGCLLAYLWHWCDCEWVLSLEQGPERVVVRHDIGAASSLVLCICGALYHCWLYVISRTINICFIFL